jgi:hypothetical protein
VALGAGPVRGAEGSMSSREMDVEEIVAERELEVLGSPSRKVIVRIGKPVRESSGEWGCPHRIEGLGEASVEVTYGVDSMQALQLAMDRVRAILGESAERVAWFGDEQLGSGMPRTVPVILPRSYAVAVEEMIDRTLARWSEDMKCRSR